MPGSTPAPQVVGTVVSSGGRYAAPGPGSDQRIFLINTAVANDPGVLFGFVVYFFTRHPVQFQIWRPMGDLNYELRFTHDVTDMDSFPLLTRTTVRDRNQESRPHPPLEF